MATFVCIGLIILMLDGCGKGWEGQYNFNGADINSSLILEAEGIASFKIDAVGLKRGTVDWTNAISVIESPTITKGHWKCVEQTIIITGKDLNGKDGTMTFSINSDGSLSEAHWGKFLKIK